MRPSGIRAGRFAAAASLLGALLAFGCSTCTRQEASEEARGAAEAHVGERPPVAEAPTGATEVTWKYADTPAGPSEVVVRVPPHSGGERFPVLIALHGRGEAFKGPTRGARGWVDDYWLPKAQARLMAPPLTEADLQGLVEPERLAQLNETLSAEPYRDFIVVCPYTPDILKGERTFESAAPFARFLLEELLPRVYRETPALGTAASTGIDGVSLGGRMSLLVGFAHPKAFGAVASLQGAFQQSEALRLAELAERALRENPALKLRLLTSTDDFFLEPNRMLAGALQQRGLESPLLVVAGPHDYDFNRGPGVIEMLVYHGRVLRGLRAP